MQQWSVVGKLPYRVKTTLVGFWDGWLYFTSGQRDKGPDDPAPRKVIGEMWRTKLSLLLWHLSHSFLFFSYYFLPMSSILKMSVFWCLCNIFFLVFIVLFDRWLGGEGYSIKYIFFATFCNFVRVPQLKIINRLSCRSQYYKGSLCMGAKLPLTIFQGWSLKVKLWGRSEVP